MALTPDEIARILGIGLDADEATAKRAYRTLAARYHPDSNPGDEAARARFAEVNEAYAAWCVARPSSDGADAPTVNLDDLMSSFAGLIGALPVGGAAQTATRGSDMRQPLRLSPAEAEAGTKRVVDVSRPIACEPCEGSGARDGAMRVCGMCGGTGKRTETHGFFRVAVSCATCAGRGKMPIARCRVCDGTGVGRQSETLTVTVPPGMRTGMMMRLHGKGGAHASAPGDLYLEIDVTDELAAFVRQGDDAVIEVPIGARLWLLGGALEVPTLDGKATVRVPRGAVDRDVVRLAGRGHPRSAASAAATVSGGPYRADAPSQTGGRGDQLVVLRVPPGARTRARVTVAVAVLGAAGGLVALLF